MKTPIRLLMVGAGYRAQNNYLPVFKLLSEEIELVGIHSKSREKLEKVSRIWDTKPIYSISEIDLTKIDVIAVSVPPSSNASVLKQLSSYEQSIDLVIDTPIALNQREYREVTPLLQRFKTVTVTEDYMNFPTFKLLRKVIRHGIIGKVRGIILYHIGYAFHGLALIRSFTNFDMIKSSCACKLGNGSRKVVSYYFKEGLRASVVGPYRKHKINSGGIVIEGTKGVISEFPSDVELNSFGSPTYLLKTFTENGHLAGCKIVGNGIEFSENFDELTKLRDMSINDISELNLLRTLGLCDVFRSVTSQININSYYGYQNALYDSFASRLAPTGAKNLDPNDIFSEALDNWSKESIVNNLQVD